MPDLRSNTSYLMLISQSLVWPAWSVTPRRGRARHSFRWVFVKVEGLVLREELLAVEVNSLMMVSIMLCSWIEPRACGSPLAAPLCTPATSTSVACCLPRSYWTATRQSPTNLGGVEVSAPDSRVRDRGIPPGTLPRRPDRSCPSLTCSARRSGRTASRDRPPGVERRSHLQRGPCR